jgi:hypothetical protein
MFTGYYSGSQLRNVQYVVDPELCGQPARNDIQILEALDNAGDRALCLIIRVTLVRVSCYWVPLPPHHRRNQQYT